MRTRGFTLLEILVATAIFGAVVSASYALLGSGQAVSSRAEARARVFQTARAAFRAVEADLRGAVMSGSAFDTGLVGTSGASNGVPADTLELVAVNSFPNRSPDPAALPGRKIDLSRVIYRIEDGKTSPSIPMGLVRERQAMLTDRTVYANRDENTEEIAPDVVGLEFRYFGDSWEESWDSTTRRKLPKAIEVAIYIGARERGAEDESPPERFVTRFYLPLGAEAPEKQP